MDTGTEFQHSNKPKAILVKLDLSGRITEAPAEFLACFHQDALELRGTAFLDLLDETIRSDFRKALLHAITHAEPVEFPYLYSLPPCDYHITIEPQLIQGLPASLNLLLSTRDIIENIPENLKQFLYRMRAGVHDSEDVIFLMDVQGTLLYITPAVRKFYLQPEQMQTYHHWIDPNDLDAVHKTFQAVLAGSVQVVECRLHASNGERPLVRIHFYPILINGQIIGVQGLINPSVSSTHYMGLMERRAAQLSLLNKIGETLSSTLNIDQALTYAVETIQKNFGFFHVAMFLPQPDNQRLRMAVRSGALAHILPDNHAIEMGQGVVGWVAANRQTLLVNDTNLDPRYLNFYPDRIPTRAEIAVPVLAGDELIGIMDVQSPIVNAFEVHDLQMLEAIAHQLSLSIQNARLVDQLQIRLEKQEHAEYLMRIQRDLLLNLSEKLNIHEALSSILDSLSSDKEIDSGAIYLADNQTGYRLAAHRGFSDRFISQGIYLAPDSPQALTAAAGSNVYLRVDDLPDGPEIPTDLLRKEGLRYLCILPVAHQGKSIAILVLASHGKIYFSEVFRDILEAIASQLGASIMRIQAENALAESEARSAAMLQAIPDIIFVIDKNGRYVASKIYPGDSLSDPDHSLAGKYISDLFSQEETQRALENIHEALQSGKTRQYEYTIMVGNPPALHHYESRIQAINHELVIAFVRDVTDAVEARKELEKREQRFRGLFENNRDAIFLINLDGHYSLANQQALDLLGYSQDEISHLTVFDIIDPREIPDAQQRFADLHAGKILPLYERTYRHKNGELIPCEINTSMVYDKDGKPLHIQSLLRDIRDRKQSDQIQSLISRNEKTILSIIDLYLETASLKTFIQEFLQLLGKAIESRSISFYKTDPAGNLQWTGSWQDQHNSLTTGLTQDVDQIIQTKSRWMSGETVIVPSDNPEIPTQTVIVPFKFQSKLYGLIKVEMKQKSDEQLKQDLALLNTIAHMIARWYQRYSDPSNLSLFDL